MTNDEFYAYVAQKKILTIPDAQKDLSIGYGEARKLFREAETKKILVYHTGLNFLYCGSDKTIINEEEEREKRFQEVRKELASQPTYFRDALFHLAEIKGNDASYLIKLIGKGPESVKRFLVWADKMKIIKMKDIDAIEFIWTKEEIKKFFDGEAPDKEEDDDDPFKDIFIDEDDEDVDDDDGNDDEDDDEDKTEKVYSKLEEIIIKNPKVDKSQILDIIASMLRDESISAEEKEILNDAVTKISALSDEEFLEIRDIILS